VNDSNHRSLRVLVADDDALSRLFVRHLLEGAGHRAVAVCDGREALALLERDGFDVALMDIEMPEMGGFEATAALRETGSELPVIAVSAHDLAEFQEQCRAAGMNACLSKPVRAQELMRLLATVTKVTRREAECSPSP
jgi:two-component system sensor histidine kinase/response regulator